MQAEHVERVAQGLGWFSIGLGLAEVIAPGKLADWIGLRDDDRTRTILRFYGMREIAAGAGILSNPRPAGWMWARVGGDLLDLASLSTAMASEHSDRGRLGAAMAAVLGVTALDAFCAQALSDWSIENGASVRITRSMMINRPADEIYRFWHDFENLPKFMSHLDSVRMGAEGRTHWHVKGPAGRTISWEAETIEDRVNERIAWRSVEGSDVRNWGSVSFQPAPGRRGTMVRIEIEYAPPGGAIGSGLLNLFSAFPAHNIEQDLRRFKQVLETGEVVHSDASIHSGMHPAQPSDREDSTTRRVAESETLQLSH